MAYSLINHRPVELVADVPIPIAGNYDPIPAVMATLVDPMYEPLMPGTSVQLLDASGAQVAPDDLAQAFLRTMGEVFDPDAESDIKNLLGQALVGYTGSSPLRVNEVFPVQAQERLGLAHPVGNTKYLASTDVIPAAKSLLAKGVDDGSLLVSLAYAYAPEALGFWFLTDQAFQDFKSWMQAQIAPIQSLLPPDTKASLAQFYATSLGTVVEGLHLRVDETDKMEEHSFARIVVHMLTTYARDQRIAASSGQAQGPQLAGMLPFLLSELYLPKHVLIANAELHASSSPNRVDAAWRLIGQALQMRPSVVPNGTIAKMTALPRALARAKSQAATAASNRNARTGRSAAITFKKRAPQKAEILGDLVKVLKRMGAVNRSQNSIRKVKTSFARANRRRPDDPNIPGKTVSTQYMPDIHLYLDCSGSVSEENYQDTVIMLIGLARKLDVNLYFSSFSHMLSEPVLLRTKGKSVAKIWNEFRRIPKVSGGTEFSQIWQFVEESPARKRRLNLVITDFEWSMDNRRVVHPKNIYYAPLAGMSWNGMRRSAKHFADSMQHIDPSLAAKFLGMMN